MMVTTLRRHLRLGALFLIALPVFCWLQWQPKAWFDHQLAAQGMRVGLHYQSLHKAFPGLQLDGVQISAPGIDTLNLDTLLLRPALSSLLKGSPALFARTQGKGMSAEAVVNMGNAGPNLSDGEIRADASTLSRFDTRLLLLGLQGNVKLHGRMQLQATDGLPLDGDIHLVWNKPSSTLLPPGLDQIRLTLAAADAQGEKIWNWKLTSQPEMIVGQGKVMAGGPDIRQWLLRGTLRTATDQPELVLSGTLGAPHWQ